jgi:DNA primase/KaiC/GvpD/RAD55 family RecA-like ATPase
MSEITPFIYDTLYPELFDRVPEAFPEHNFKYSRNGWQSNTYLNGKKHERADKTVITDKVPSRIMEQGGESISLIDYVMKRDGSTFIDATKKLSQFAGVTLPEMEGSENYQREQNIYETLNDYFLYSLGMDNTQANEIRAYLNGRGYQDKEIKLMEIGYTPSQDRISEHLKNKGFTVEDITQFISFSKAIGDTHKISVPYRVGSRIKGFKFRAIDPTISRRYINSTGLEKSSGFFNISALKGDKDLIIMEGELDALHASIKGIKNVVSIGGSKINEEQIQDALKRGAKSFTLCLDRDSETVTNVNNAIRVIQETGVTRIYIVELPDLGGKTDPDRLIKEEGIDALKAALHDPQEYYKYQLDYIFNKYAKIEEDNEEERLTARQKDALIDDVLDTAKSLIDPIQRNEFSALFLGHEAIKQMGITREACETRLNELLSIEEQKERQKALKNLSGQIAHLEQEGKVNEALELIGKELKELNRKSGKDLIPKPNSFASYLDKIKHTPPKLITGFPSLDDFTGFAPGAITLIAGRPSHGKTTLLLNFLWNLTQNYPTQNFYFLTYEEPSANIIVKLLNLIIDRDLNEVSPTAILSNYEYLKTYIKNNRNDIEAIEEAKQILGNLIDSGRVKIIDSNNSVEELYKIFIYQKDKEPIGAVLIDYIQRMNTEQRTQDKRTEIGHISDQVLRIAKDTGLPIILGAQLNRSTQKGLPRLENLKEAGNLEEDANTVLSVYDESREPTEDGEEETAKIVELQVTALKNREGQVNRSSRLEFKKYTQRISDRNDNPKF